ncbi:hypothetical protein CA11_05140 [Gimesia maris]|nr:hypothetical protein CA11_05140 [Gimesia maris]
MGKIKVSGNKKFMVHYTRQGYQEMFFVPVSLFRELAFSTQHMYEINPAGGQVGFPLQLSRLVIWKLLVKLL